MQATRSYEYYLTGHFVILENNILKKYFYLLKSSSLLITKVTIFSAQSIKKKFLKNCEWNPMPDAKYTIRNEKNLNSTRMIREKFEFNKNDKKRQDHIYFANLDRGFHRRGFPE